MTTEFREQSEAVEIILAHQAGQQVDPDLLSHAREYLGLAEGEYIYRPSDQVVEGACRDYAFQTVVERREAAVIRNVLCQIDATAGHAPDKPVKIEVAGYVVAALCGVNAGKAWLRALRHGANHRLLTRISGIREKNPETGGKNTFRKLLDGIPGEGLLLREFSRRAQPSALLAMVDSGDIKVQYIFTKDEFKYRLESDLSSVEPLVNECYSRQSLGKIRSQFSNEEKFWIEVTVGREGDASEICVTPITTWLSVWRDKRHVSLGMPTIGKDRESNPESVVESSDSPSTSASPIRFRCTRCEMRVKAPAKMQGKQAKCPNCGNRVQIPAS